MNPVTLFSFVASTFVLMTSPLAMADDDIASWCKKFTPFPQECESYARSYSVSQPPPIKGFPDFFKLALQSAFTTAATVTKNAYSLGPNLKDPKEKAAWADCVELYELALHHLNKTISPVTKHTNEDAQTWISSALTYYETCKDGFSDLALSNSPILPLVANDDVSHLISNALAINKKNGVSNVTNDEPVLPAGFKKLQVHGGGEGGGWPSWLRPGDRKLLQQSNLLATWVNLVVAQDGSGDYTTVSEAVAAATKRSGNGRFVIHIRAGTYQENVVIGSGVENVMLLGDGIGQTIITGSRSVGGGSTTFRSATVSAQGPGFIAQGITFRNTAGPLNHQAVALLSASDLSVFYQCNLEGYQDTLYVFSNRQFYRDCNIYGTVDFIFGNAAVVIQNCNIFAHFPPATTNTLTAQGRTDPNQNTGIIIHRCQVAPALDLIYKIAEVNTYLGRPWKAYSRTVYMETVLHDLINPAGWMPWNGDFALNTLYYAEYRNTGPGSYTAKRVNWPGYHIIETAAVASQFTVANFIAGDSWLPAIRVPFIAGL